MQLKSQRPVIAYQPKFHMPIISTPPPDTDPVKYYDTLTGEKTILQVIPDANLGLKIKLSDPKYSQLFAITGGLVTFIPPGNPLPTTGAELSPGSGSIVLQTWSV